MNQHKYNAYVFNFIFYNYIVKKPAKEMHEVKSAYLNGLQNELNDIHMQDQRIIRPINYFFK